MWVQGERLLCLQGEIGKDGRIKGKGRVGYIIAAMLESRIAGGRVLLELTLRSVCRLSQLLSDCNHRLCRCLSAIWIVDIVLCRCW